MARGDHSAFEAGLAQFEKHLDRCPSCAEEVRGLRETAARLGIATSIVPPTAMRRQVLETGGGIALVVAALTLFLRFGSHEASGR